MFSFTAFSALTKLMGPQGHGAAGVHQRVPCNAGLFMVGAAEPAVNDDQTAPALDGALAALLPHRHMAVDDVAGAGQTEFRQDAAAGGLFIVPCIIGVLDFLVGCGVGNIQPLKGGHGAAAEQRRQLAAPQIPQKVLTAPPGSTSLGAK